MYTQGWPMKILAKEGETLPDGLEHTGGGTGRVPLGLFVLT